jgi:hypothetical protein
MTRPGATSRKTDALAQVSGAQGDSRPRGVPRHLAVYEGGERFPRGDDAAGPKIAAQERKPACAGSWGVGRFSTVGCWNTQDAPAALAHLRPTEPELAVESLWGGPARPTGHGKMTRYDETRQG